MDFSFDDRSHHSPSIWRRIAVQFDCSPDMAVVYRVNSHNIRSNLYWIVTISMPDSQHSTTFEMSIWIARTSQRISIANRNTILTISASRTVHDTDSFGTNSNCCGFFLCPLHCSLYHWTESMMEFGTSFSHTYMCYGIVYTLRSQMQPPPQQQHQTLADDNNCDGCSLWNYHWNVDLETT